MENEPHGRIRMYSVCISSRYTIIHFSLCIEQLNEKG